MTSLDVLILLLLERGIATPYALRSRARISLGASLPALKRLARQRLIKESKPGPRGRREFALTPAGQNELAHLDQYLQAAVIDPGSDLDSVLRLAVCAMSTGKDEIALKVLKRAGDEFTTRSEDLRNTLPKLNKSKNPADLYTAMIGHCEAEMLKVSGSALRTLASHFGNRSAKKAGRHNPRPPSS